MLDDDSFNIEEKTSGHIKAKWRLGRKSKNCFGFGICKLDEVKAKIERVEITIYENKSLGSYLVKEDNETIRLEINKEYLQKINDEFGGDFLILEEDFTLDRDDCNFIEISNDFTLKAGTYNFEENIYDSNILYVRFSNK